MGSVMEMRSVEDRKPVRPTEDIPCLRARCADLERRVTELEGRLEAVDHLQETVDQLMGVIECGKVPAPIFLRWQTTEEEGCHVARARFGRYRLEVVNGRSAVIWSIQEGEKWLDAGGGHTSFYLGMDEAEQALRRIIQQKQAEGGASR